MTKIWICAAAIGAALVFAAPASAKNAKHMNGNGYAYGHAKSKHMMPLRSNRGGMMHGQTRARYVQKLNRSKRMDRY